MHNTLFDLEHENILLSKKIIAVFATETSEYLLFIKIWAELDHVKNQLNSELYFNEELTLCNKNTWEGFNVSTTKGNRNKENHKQELCNKCRKEDGNLIKY